MSILADTSIWVDHFRVGNGQLTDELEQGEILMHPFVLGELLLGGLRRRRNVIEHLRALPQALLATLGEVEALIEGVPLDGRGIGYVDAALLASVRLQADARLWTADRQLARAATDLGIALAAG